MKSSSNDIASLFSIFYGEINELAWTTLLPDLSYVFNTIWRVIDLIFWFFLNTTEPWVIFWNLVRFKRSLSFLDDIYLFKQL